MKEFILKKPKKVLENKKVIESALHIKINVTGRQASISGDELSEYLAIKIFEAIELGFDIETSILLSKEDYIFEKIEIKNLTKRKNLKEVRARLIGKQGRTKELIEELSECYISIHLNEIGIIGEADKIKNAMQALTKIIQGSKQSSVYAYLEKQRKIYRPEDLGLKLGHEEEE